MKRYFARRKSDGLFLSKGIANLLPCTTIDKISDSNWWKKVGHIKAAITLKNNGRYKLAHLNFNDFEIIELDISEVLLHQIQKRASLNATTI